jgi:hypothetical protein
MSTPFSPASRTPALLLFRSFRKLTGVGCRLSEHGAGGKRADKRHPNWFVFH